MSQYIEDQSVLSPLSIFKVSSSVPRAWHVDMSTLNLEAVTSLCSAAIWDVPEEKHVCLSCRKVDFEAYQTVPHQPVQLSLKMTRSPPSLSQEPHCLTLCLLAEWLPVHTTCAYHLYTMSVHTACAHHLYTLPVHTTVHTTCMHHWCAPPICWAGLSGLSRPRVTMGGQDTSQCSLGEGPPV